MNGDDVARDEALLYAYARYQGELRMVPRTIPVTQPAAGAEWSVTVAPAIASETSVVWILGSFVATLTTSNAVANRFPRVLFKDANGVEIARTPYNSTQTASLAEVYSGFRGVSALSGSTAALSWATPIPHIPLLTGFTISSSTVAIDVGDQWSAISLFVVEVSQRPASDLAAFADEIAQGSPRFEQYPGLTLGLT